MHLLAEPHHDGSALHVPVRPRELDDVVPVYLRVPHTFPVSGVHLRSVADAEPRYVAAVPERQDGHDVWWRAELTVHNPSTNYRWLLSGVDGAQHRTCWQTAAGLVRHDPTDATDHRLTVYPAPPAWTLDSVFYQVFPDRFARGSNSGPLQLPSWAVAASWEDPVVYRGPDTPRQIYGGDLVGLAERLDYLADLGITTVYLTPFFPAESNHRYNATTFDRVDPLLGGDEALVALTRAAHARGMRVVGDLTTNHTGDTHEWFQRAVADPGAAEAAYYRFTDHPRDYVSWYGVATLPKLDHTATDLRRRLVDGPDSVVARWLSEPYCLDGWRIDVANMTGRHGADDHAHEVARAVRATAETAAGERGAFVVAEHCYDASADLQGDGWQAGMNYAGFTKPVWSWLTAAPDEVRYLGMPVPVPAYDGAVAAATMRAVLAAVPWTATAHAVNLLGSHDTARVRTVVGDLARQRVAAGLLLTFPGIPMLFMGDELGLTGVDGEASRTPMPWNDLTGDRASTRGTYRELLALRRASPALRSGGLRWVYAGADVLAYLRETDEDRLLVLAARGDHDGLELPAGLAPRGATVLYGAGDLRREGPTLRCAPGTTGVTVWRLAG